MRCVKNQIDPESKRTVGVVTKTHLVRKEMNIVEKLQMTSYKAVALPLGCVRACVRSFSLGYTLLHLSVVRFFFCLPFHGLRGRLGFISSSESHTLAWLRGAVNPSREALAG